LIEFSFVSNQDTTHMYRKILITMTDIVSPCPCEFILFYFIICQDGDSDKATGTLELPSETAKDNCESRKKGKQQTSSTTKASGKNAKQGSQASDPPNEGYVHVRARRGQATNSHSLAERVRCSN